MTRRKEHIRLQQLLTRGITELCKSCLTYQNEFNIEGLIGVTLDKEEIFLVNVNECVEKCVEKLDDTDVTLSTGVYRDAYRSMIRSRYRSSTILVQDIEMTSFFFRSINSILSTPISGFMGN